MNPIDNRLFSIIKKCYQEKFWEVFDDSQLIALQLPREKEPVFISIMGKEAEAYGFLIYRGFEEVSYLYEGLKKLSKTAYNLTKNDLIHQKCTVVYFEDREDLEKHEYHRVKQSNVTFRGRKAWPVIVDFTPGFLPTTRTKTENLWLIHILEKFYETARILKEDMSIYNQKEILDLTAFPGRIYDMDENYKEHVFEIPALYRQGITTETFGQLPILLSRFEILRTMQTPLKQTLWEMDIECINVPVEVTEEGETLERPYYPLLFMVADELSQDVLMLELMKSHDIEWVQRRLIRLFLDQDTRPTSISINETTAVYIQYFFGAIFERLDMQVLITDHLPILDYLKEDLEDVSFFKKE